MTLAHKDLEVSLGGLVILAELPTTVKDGVRYCTGSIEGWHRFEQRLLDMPGCKEWQGPLINGLHAITFELIDYPALNAGLASEMVRACWKYRWSSSESWQNVLMNMRANIAMEAVKKV